MRYLSSSANAGSKARKAYGLLKSEYILTSFVPFMSPSRISLSYASRRPAATQDAAGICLAGILRIKRRSAVEVAKRAAQAKLGHFDRVVDLHEDHSLPFAAPGMNFDQVF